MNIFVRRLLTPSDIYEEVDIALGNAGPGGRHNLEVFEMIQDRRGRLWMGMHGGVMILDGEKNQWRLMADFLETPHVNHKVLALLEDRLGNIWIGFGKTTLFSLVLLSLAFSTSCKKDDKEGPGTPDLKEMISGTWQLTALTVDPAIDWFGTGTKVSNIYAQLPACVKDDLTVFSKNGTVSFDEGPSKCFPDDPQTTGGTWALSVDRKVLSVTQDGETENWAIGEINTSAMKYTYEETDDNGITYTFFVAFAKRNT